jgi:peroxiredoxin
LQGAREQFRRAGAEIVLIGQATPRDAANFRRQLKLDLPVLADEHRTSYKAVGAKVAGIGGLFGPKVVLRAVGAMLGQHVTQGRTIGHPAQLGAALVVAPGGEVLFSQLAADASDNASPREMLAALEGRPAKAID